MSRTLIPEPEREKEVLTNLRRVLEAVERKKVNECRLVAVFKTKPSSDIVAAMKNGQEHFGENYFQELEWKAKELPRNIKWHYIGNLQSNKCKALAAIPNLWAVETIDGEPKAKKMNNAWKAAGHEHKLNVFVQVNSSNEPNKGGVEPEIVVKVLAYIKENCPSLNLLGIMTIGAIENSAMVPNPDFVKMAAIRKKCEEQMGIPIEISMGMSADYEHALEMGSNNVRVGATIVGPRSYPRSRPDI